MNLLNTSCLAALLLLAPVAVTQDAKPILLPELGGTLLEWTMCNEQPTWLTKPTRQAGMFPIATVRRSDQLGLAKSRAIGLAQRDVREVLFEHLWPVLGEKQTLPVVEVLVAHTQLVESCCQGPAKVQRGRRPGRTVSHAYMRWQIPVREAVAALPPAVQGRVEWTLLRDVVAWESVSEAPKWVKSIPAESGQFRFVFTTEKRLPNEATEAALASVRHDTEVVLLARLTPVIGESLAREAVARGLAQLAPVKRATWFRSGVSKKKMRMLVRPTRRMTSSNKLTSAYSLWQIPVATLVRGLPGNAADRVREQLAQPAAR